MADRTRSERCDSTGARSAPGSQLTNGWPQDGGSAHHKQEKSGNHHHHGRRPQHTLVPLHPLPGPAHRRQAEVRPPPPNSQRKGSRCDRCPCEDHAQLWRAQKQPTQAVCSRRRLHTPVRSPRLEHSSTNASLHTTGGVSPPTSLPACDRRPAACRLRGHICPCRHTTAGPSRGRASAALRPPPRGRKGRGTLGNAKQVGRATRGMTTAMNDGLQSPQGQTSVEKSGVPSLTERTPLPSPRTSPSTIVKAISEKIIVAPLHCKEKDFTLPSLAECATGTTEDKLERMDGLIWGLGHFLRGKTNLHKEVFSYQVSLGMALSALEKSLESRVPPRPPAADKAVCTSPLFTGSAMSKRPADSSPEMRVPSKRSVGVTGPIQSDENNNVAEDCDNYVLVDHQRRRRRKPQPQLPPERDPARRSLKPRPQHRRVHHRPDAIIIKANDASTYAEILKKLKREPALQQTVGSSVNNIRRSATGALGLQLKKGGENAPALDEELGRVLGTAATASALLHTSMIEIKDLDECVTKEEVTMVLDALLGVQVSKRDPVKSLRKAYAGTQVAVVALPDDLAATALKLGHVRIGWLELPSGPEDHPGPPMMRILQLNLNHCETAQDLLCDTISKLRIDVAILCEQYKNLAPPNTWLADADGQAAIWVHGGIPVQERPARVHPYFAWARIDGIFFFSVYAPPRLSEMEFSALLANITKEARGRRPLVIAMDFNAWSTEWGCRETRPRASILLDSLALLDAVLLNTGDVPTFNGRQGSSIVDLTFVCETITPRVKSWTVSGWYTHSDHQAIVFEIEDTGTSTRPSTRQSCRWNARTLDADRFSAAVSSASVTPGTAEDMASSLMSVITGACDASMSKVNQKRRCWRQLCDEVNSDVWGKPYKIAMSRLRCPQIKQPSSPLLVRSAVAAVFPRVPSGPALQLPHRAEEPIPAVTLEELKGAQSRIKERSAPGLDGIPNSALKIAIAARPDIFLQVYTTCLETGVFPSGWKRQRLVLLLKSGKPPDEPSSYRPLCMLGTAGKILERIICDRLEALTERPRGLSERQYGFRKGRSTIDAIEDVISTAQNAVVGRRWFRGPKKYCAVVTLDVRNAFNSARWDNILAALCRLLVPDYLLRIIASYFSARVLDFTTDDGPESYEVTAGVPQGRPQHTLVPFHPLPGPAHRRQAEVRPPPPNSQREGSRCDRCPHEDHAQLWRAQK
ncbi:unnamed protein product [Trichogramma brassicae]|uniref:Reverse transcriptase domain-containing protein n=1 Tax=Trichogramma brassicae TaxID=86971 RepID=A0A6H5IL24_9HYME|nr:unnamed protein product [Trichogramma brassicae]